MPTRFDTLPPVASPQGARAAGIELPAEELARLHALDGAHFARGALFVALYAASAYAAWQLASLGGWAWLACVPLYLVAAASLHGLSLFVHEAVHGVLSPNRQLNRALAILTALPVLQTFTAYRVLHLSHHRSLGQPGDPDHYANYTDWTWLETGMHWGRLLMGYPAYVSMIPVLGFRQGTANDRLWIAFEVALLGLLVAAVWLSPIPRGLLLHGWLVPMLCINTMVNIRGMSQHTWLSDLSDPVLGSRSILTNPLTRFFMCNENYHLEHHLYPGVPWSRLPALHRAIQPQLEARGATFIPSYWAFVRGFVADSYRCSPLGRRRLHQAGESRGIRAGRTIARRVEDHMAGNPLIGAKAVMPPPPGAPTAPLPPLTPPTLAAPPPLPDPSTLAADRTTVQPQAAARRSGLSLGSGPATAPLPASSAPPSLLKSGSTGPEVSALQTSLGIPASGTYDAATVAAVTAYQQKNGLKVDGKAGPETRSAMDVEKQLGTAMTLGATPPSADPAVNAQRQTQIKAAMDQAKQDLANYRPESAAARAKMAQQIAAQEQALKAPAGTTPPAGGAATPPKPNPALAPYTDANGKIDYAKLSADHIAGKPEAAAAFPDALKQATPAQLGYLMSKASESGFLGEKDAKGADEIAKAAEAGGKTAAMVAEMNSRKQMSSNAAEAILRVSSPSTLGTVPRDQIKGMMDQLTGMASWSINVNHTAWQKGQDVLDGAAG